MGLNSESRKLNLCNSGIFKNKTRLAPLQKHNTHNLAAMSAGRGIHERILNVCKKQENQKTFINYHT